MIFVFTAVLLVYLVMDFGLVFKAVVPYWCTNRRLNVSILMLIFMIVVGCLVTHPNSTELIGAVTEDIYKLRNARIPECCG